MKRLLMHLTETESLAKLESLQSTVIAIMQAILDAAKYIEDYLNKGSLGNNTTYYTIYMLQLMLP
jgi:hypothetical protein